MREHCGAEEQRQLVYRSLLVMPLRLLEQVLPWLMTLLTEEEAEQMRHNMRLAGETRQLSHDRWHTTGVIRQVSHDR